MTITIPDEVLQSTGLSERDALIEFACHLFDKELLPLWPAARLANLSRDEFEDELLRRKIAIYRYDVEDLAADLRTIEALRALRSDN